MQKMKKKKQDEQKMNAAQNEDQFKDIHCQSHSSVFWCEHPFWTDLSQILFDFSICQAQRLRWKGGFRELLNGLKQQKNLHSSRFSKSPQLDFSCQHPFQTDLSQSQNDCRAIWFVNLTSVKHQRQIYSYWRICEMQYFSLKLCQSDTIWLAKATCFQNSDLPLLGDTF